MNKLVSHDDWLVVYDVFEIIRMICKNRPSYVRVHTEAVSWLSKDYKGPRCMMIGGVEIRTLAGLPAGEAVASPFYPLRIYLSLEEPSVTETKEEQCLPTTKEKQCLPKTKTVTS